MSDLLADGYLARLTDAARVDYYVSGNDGGRVFWPWRMGKAAGKAGTHEDMADVFVLDSNFTDESVTNRDVLDEAVTKDADVASLADVLHDADATVRALREGIELAREHPFDGTLLLPSQPPHDETASRLLDAASGLDVWWGVGGVKDEPTAVKVDAARRLRTVIGDDAHLHGLGVGVTPAFAAVVKQDPALFDSIDNSTAMQNARVSDLAGTPEKMSVVAARGTATRLRNLRRLTPYADEKCDTHQSTIGDSVTPP